MRKHFLILMLLTLLPLAGFATDYEVVLYNASKTFGDLDPTRPAANWFKVDPSGRLPGRGCYVCRSIALQRKVGLFCLYSRRHLYDGTSLQPCCTLCALPLLAPRQAHGGGFKPLFSNWTSYFRHLGVYTCSAAGGGRMRGCMLRVVVLD